MESALECRSLSKRFGGLAALIGVDLRVGKGDIFGVIGPNGSGKTTLFNLISGTLKPTSGEIHFEGRKISTLAPDAICRLGIARTYQPVRPFGRLTALENVLVSVCFGRDQSLSRSLRVQDALTVLDFVGLARKAHDTAQSLTIGDRKRLEIARGLATNPKVLLLDEVISGLTPVRTSRDHGNGPKYPAPRCHGDSDRTRNESSDSFVLTCSSTPPRREDRRRAS